MDRKRLSGTGFRLKAKEKAKQIADVGKTKNIKHFFTISTNCAANVTADSSKKLMTNNNN